MKFMWQIGERLRKARLRVKLNLGQVSEYEAIAKSYLSQLETGKNTPNWDLLARLARRYKTSADYILGLTDDPTPKLKEIRPNMQLSNFEHQPPALNQRALDQIARILAEVEQQARETTAQDIMQTVSEYITRFKGEQASKDFYYSVEILNTTGEDTALIEWFRRYFG